MKHNPTLPVNCAHGAPMGRYGKAQDCQGMVSLRRIRLDSGGYDPGGAYWGHGQPLYWAGDESGAFDTFLRARDRADAKRQILEDWPDARFNR